MDKSFYDDLYLDIPLDVRRKYSIVGTAEWVYDLMVDQVPIVSSASYLDPCVGRGVGIKSLLKAGVKEEQITACDIVENNISYCKSIYKNVNYLTQDLLTLTGHYDYVIGVPPWCKQLPKMLTHLISLSTKKCILMATFFYGNRRYKSLERMVKRFCVDDFDTLVKFALSGSHYFKVACIYEFAKSSWDGAVGLHNILVDWISGNGLSDYFTFDVKQSVPHNLVLYTGQEYFLPINKAWFMSYLYNGFSVDKVNEFSIFGSIMPGRKCYGLVYGSQASLDKAREHYSSLMVKKMLVCGVDFGWKHLKLV